MDCEGEEVIVGPEPFVPADWTKPCKRTDILIAAKPGLYVNRIFAESKL